jgi:hypothetical protein
MTTDTLPPYKEFVRGLFNRSGSPAQDFAHAVLGLSTEVYELDNATSYTNSIEELGDLAFYDQALEIVVADAFGIDVNSLPVRTLGEMLAANPNWDTERALAGDGLIAMDIRTFCICEMQDTAKRWIGYGKAPSPEKAAETLAMAVAAFDLSAHLVSGAEIGSPECRLVADLAVRANFDKLRARYKGSKFSQEAALNRDLDAELKVLDEAVAATS